jgi:putative ABC transport system permease protein
VSWSHAVLAVPVGLGVALLAAAPPALAASRARPWTAVLSAPARVRRARRRHSVIGLALANQWRVPGRTALGVGSLAVGVGALTVLVVVAVVFRNDVVGTLLGDAVAVRVRAVDVLAAGTAVVIGVLMVADVLYINVRERAAELAALWAGGWSNRALLKLVGYEGLGMGVLGGVLGAGAGLLGVGWFVGQLSLAMVWLAVGVAAGAVVVATVAAVVPALVLRRLPLSTLLAEE